MHDVDHDPFNLAVEEENLFVPGFGYDAGDIHLHL